MDSSPHHKSGHHHQPKSSSELFSSAKVLAEAAQATFSHGSVNKAKAAGAASDLLDAACQYGNLEDGKFGQYFDKAETYLHQYQSADHSSAAARCGGKTNAAAHGGGSGYGESDGGYDEYQSSDHSTAAHGGAKTNAVCAAAEAVTENLMVGMAGTSRRITLLPTAAVKPRIHRRNRAVVTGNLKVSTAGTSGRITLLPTAAVNPRIHRHNLAVVTSNLKVSTAGTSLRITLLPRGR